MKTVKLPLAENQDTKDFAIVGVFGGNVVLEANEWDLSLGTYRVVTLYLNPKSARNLAEQLVSCATGASPSGETTH